MAAIKKQYFIKGVDVQKIPDLTFDFKRIDISKINELGIEERAGVKKFIDECKSYLDTLIDNIH